MDSTPLVCVTGQVRSHLIGTDAFQECDITGITIPIVKHSWLVQDVEELPQAIKSAFHVARTGRCGPVLVDIPRDVQEAELDFEYPDDVDLPGWRPPRRACNAKQVREAAQAIAGAERPVLYVGGGTINARGVRRAAPRSPSSGRLPVVTTLMAKGAFPETHELHFGWPGMHGAKWSNWAMNKCDVLVAVGARFDDRVTGKLAAFAPGASVVHLDVDAAEIGKLRSADVPGRRPAQADPGRARDRARGAGGRRRDLADRTVARPARRLARASSRSATAAATCSSRSACSRALQALTERPRRRHLDDRRRPAPDVGDAVPPVRRAAQLHHVGRSRHDGLRPPGRGRREGGAARRDGRLRGRRRLLPDDLPGARDGGAPRTCRSSS